jgi:sRNA-binding carbon storage regulator CsrA
VRILDCHIDRGLVLTLPDGRTVRVVVVDVTRNRDGQRARIGVDAPRDVPVHRSEVHDALRAGGGEPPPS